MYTILTFKRDISTCYYLEIWKSITAGLRVPCYLVLPRYNKGVTVSYIISLMPRSTGTITVTLLSSRT